MTASTMPHTTARHATVRPSGHAAARRASGGVPDNGAERPGAVSAVEFAVSAVECEDGCHYCQGPETD